MFKWNRVLVALLGVPLLIFVYTNVSFAGLPLLFFSLFVVGVGLSEFYDMVKTSGRQTYKNFGIIMGLSIVIATYFKNIAVVSETEIIGKLNIYLLDSYLSKIDFYFGNINVNYIVPTLTIIIILVYRVFKNQIVGTLDSVATTVLGLIYVAVFFSQIINLYFIDLFRTNYYDGEAPFLTIILILQILVWISDTSAGIVGVTIGRKYFKNGFTEISPKKSVEGAIGSLIFTGLAAVIICFLMMATNDFKILLGAFTLGGIVSLIAQIGDLIESLFKRECGVKDSGTILMGHGGILDRFDSMLLVLPVASLILI